MYIKAWSIWERIRFRLFSIRSWSWIQVRLRRTGNKQAEIIVAGSREGREMDITKRVEPVYDSLRSWNCNTASRHNLLFYWAVCELRFVKAN